MFPVTAIVFAIAFMGTNVAGSTLDARHNVNATATKTSTGTRATFICGFIFFVLLSIAAKLFTKYCAGGESVKNHPKMTQHIANYVEHYYLPLDKQNKER
jgi:hypothetical protein